MPRDLFGHVTRPSMSAGNRKWYTVPVSLVSHSLILAMCLALPILAAPLMPKVLGNDDLNYVIKILPPPPPPPKLSNVIKPAGDPNLAPTVAPTGFTKEPEVLRDPPSDAVGWIGGADDVDKTLAPPPPPPVQTTQPPSPVHVGGAVRAPQKVREVNPVYPPIAQSARVQGIVIIEATIGVDGRVVDARILRSVTLLDQAALEAVRQWQYTPTLLNGVPVPVIMTVTVNFTLR